MPVPTLDDHEGRIRAVEGVAAENRWRLDTVEQTLKKTAELLQRVEQQVEHAEWERSRTTATITRWQAILAGVTLAIVSPATSAIVAHFVH